MNLENMRNNEKRQLAWNPNTPVTILHELAQDTYWRVREYVAKNPNIPLNLLNELVKDEKWEVRRQAATHPRVTTKILITLFEYEKSLNNPSRFIIKGLYKNKMFPGFAKRVIETLFNRWM